MSGNYTNNWQISALGGGVLAASQNTISLGNLNGAQGSGYSGSFNFDELLHTMSSPDVKKYEVYEISVDLLALSVCWARYRKQRGNGVPQPHITKLLDSELFRLVTEEDVAQADVIRDYYSKKIMVWKLKNIALTRFREDLNTFVHSDGKTFKETMLPLVFRLPEFYEYDVEFEKMSFEYNKEVKQQETTHATERKHLKFVKQLHVNNKRTKRKEYWFSDLYNNLVTFSVETHNPLSTLLDMTLRNNDIDVVGRYKKCLRDGNEYLKLDNKFTFV